MTVSLRAVAAGRNARHESAPALFRLLSDSAMSRAALASCGAAVAIVDAQDANWPIAYLNPALERLFGHRDCETQGKSFVPLVLQRDAGAQDRMLEAVRARHEVSASHKSGTPLDVEAMLGPVHDTNGRLTHWVLTFADRSELTRLRGEVAALKSTRTAERVSA